MNQLLNALGKPRLKIDQSRCCRPEQASQVQGEENAGDTNRHAEVGASVPGETEQQHSKDGYQHQADFSRGRFYIGVAEVSGQDQLRLNQRKHQAADDDRRHDRHDLAHEADTEHQWHEGRDCGQHTEGYGNRDALRAFDRAWQHLEAFLVARMHTLADDDGIVDEDTLFATASTVLITLVAGARILYGMAKSRTLPEFLGRVHPKTKTPWIAVIGILAASIGFAFVGDIVIIANIVVFAVVITFAAINLAVIVLRYTEPVLERPFRVPVNIGKFPILPLFGFGTTVYMALQFETEIILVGLSIIAIGAVLYLFLRRRKDFMNSN